MQRDPLLGNLFENLVITEALKTRLNSGAEPNLYFFRNSKGLEVDLILKKENKLKLFEIKSGKSLNDEFTKKSIKNIILSKLDKSVKLDYLFIRGNYAFRIWR